ncbi:terminase small subunit [Periweissella fabalis]|uniref:Terminase small subunit n=1 Tax=Periweissella fabalis TaxID=1070421 RepID=A0A7X6S216_9LACO|nr:terminase small subunit [Periweissella fabalis]MCM0599216.1 terminase small subunit [Periweissella fabalis]NKZ23495.1 terminase small subunit [Periweissella fabalis]
MKSYNATQAYMNAYDVTYDSARVLGSKMLTNINIRAEIERLKKEKTRKLDLSYESLLLDLAREANADIGEYVNFASHDETVVDGKGKPVLDVNGAEIIAHKSQVWLKDKADVDTSLIKKVSVGKDGVQLELHDRSKARDELLKRLAPDEKLKALQIERAKTELELAKKKLELLNGGTEDNVTINIQPFGGDE